MPATSLLMPVSLASSRLVGMVATEEQVPRDTTAGRAMCLNMMPHSALAAAEPCEQGESGEDIDEAQGIVDQHGAAVARGNIGAVGSDQIGKDGEESDGSVVGDDLDEFHHHVRQAGEPLTHDGVRYRRSGLYGEAEQDGEYDQGQHGAAAQQTHEVSWR